MKIYAIHNNAGSRFYRIIPQLRWMQRAGHEVLLEDNKNITLDKIKWADIVVFQMVFAPAWLKIAKQLRKKTVFDCDDLLHILPKDHYGYADTKGIKNRLKWWYRIWQCIGGCDLLITSNKELRRKYGWLTKSVVFENYCDLEHWIRPFKPNKKSNDEEIRLLWAGSTSHTGDLNKMKPVLKRILKKYPNVKFLYMGMGGTASKDLKTKFIYGEDFFADLHDNRESLLPVPANIYPHILATIQADIAIAPLNKNYFNKFKTQCKFFEYSINQIPAVYSKWFYTEILNNRTGLVADTEEEWFNAICYLIDNWQERKLLGEEASNYIKKHKDIRTNLVNWQGFIEQLYESTKIEKKIS